MTVHWSTPKSACPILIAASITSPVVQQHLSFVPDMANPDLFVAVFVIPLAIQWWNVW